MPDKRSNKRLIIILAVLIVLIAVGFGIYYFVKQKAAPGEGILETLFPGAGEIGEPGLPGLFRPDGEIKEKPKLVRLSDVPVAGFAALDRGRVRYAERATGHIYEISGDGEDKIRISNTTIPRVYQTIWSEDGNYVVLSVLDESQHPKQFLATLTSTTTEGVFLPEESIPFAFSEKNQIIYLMKTNNRYAIVQSDAQNKNQAGLYSSPFRDFIISWLSNDLLGLVTRSSGSVDGYLYELDLKQNSLNKIIGDLKGLTALWSPDARQILISEFNERANEIRSRVIDRNGAALKDINGTLADKCAWSRSDAFAIYCAIPDQTPVGTYPDDWYKGKVSFNDTVNKLYLSATSTETLLDKQNFDIQNIGVDAHDEFLYFIDKNDEMLWGLRL